MFFYLLHKQRSIWKENSFCKHISVPSHHCIVINVWIISHCPTSLSGNRGNSPLYFNQIESIPRCQMVISSLIYFPNHFLLVHAKKYKSNWCWVVLTRYLNLFIFPSWCLFLFSIVQSKEHQSNWSWFIHAKNDFYLFFANWTLLICKNVGWTYY